MFASRTKKTIEVMEGTEKGTVVIRKLSARSLDKAREARQIAAAEITSRFGADLIRAFRETTKEEEAAKPAEAVDPKIARAAEYDRFTILTQGIESWSWQTIKLETGIADLDEPTAELLFNAILDLSAPLKEEAEKIEKNV